MSANYSTVYTPIDVKLGRKVRVGHGKHLGGPVSMATIMLPWQHQKLVFGACSGLIDPELGIRGIGMQVSKTLTTVAMMINYHSNNKIIMYLGKSIFMPGPLQSVCAGESQGGNPIGSVLVSIIGESGA